MSELRRLEPSVWDVPVGYVDGRRVPGIVFASDELLARAVEDRAVEQVANVATLPGIVGACYAMPDIHWGYGFPIGGVAATDVAAGGVVSPGGVGFDVLAGDRRAEARSLSSTCHGAGRSMSRTRARKLMSGPDLRRQLEGEGLVLAASTGSCSARRRRTPTRTRPPWSRRAPRSASPGGGPAPSGRGPEGLSLGRASEGSEEAMGGGGDNPPQGCGRRG